MILPLLIVDFFRFKHISHAVLLLCSNTDDINMVKFLSHYLVSGVTLPHMTNVDRFAMALNGSGKLGIIVDTSCRRNMYVIRKGQSNINDKTWLLLKGKKSENSWFHCPNKDDVTIVVTAHILRSKNIPLFDCNHNRIAEWNMLKRVVNEEKCNISRSRPNINAVRVAVTGNGRDEFENSVINLLSYNQHFKFNIKEIPKMRVKSADFWMLEQVLKGNVDIGLSTVLITPDRINLVDYSLAVEEFKPQLYYKVHSVRTARNVYILPFSIAVWLTLISLLLTITVTLTFVLGSETRLSRINEEWTMMANLMQENEIAPDWELSEVLLVTIGVISQQGSSKNMNTVAARILFLSELLLAVLLYTAYSASIISIMSSPGPATNTLQGILDGAGGVGLALYNNHYYHSQFKVEKSDWSYKLGHAEVSASFHELSSGMALVIQGTAAFCADRVEARTYLHQSGQSVEALCSVGEIMLLQGPGYYRAFVFPLKSNYKRIINDRLVILRERGLLSREKRRWFRSDTLCQSPDAVSSKFVQVALDDIYPALQLFGYSIAGALCILITENILNFLISYARIKVTE